MPPHHIGADDNHILGPRFQYPAHFGQVLEHILNIPIGDSGPAGVNGKDGFNHGVGAGNAGAAQLGIFGRRDYFRPDVLPFQVAQGTGRQPQPIHFQLVGAGVVHSIKIGRRGQGQVKISLRIGRQVRGAAIRRDGYRGRRLFRQRQHPGDIAIQPLAE